MKMTDAQCDALMVDQGLARYDRLVEERGDALNSGPASGRLMGEAVTHLAGAIRDWMASQVGRRGPRGVAYKFLKIPALTPEVVALVAARAVLDATAHSAPYLTVAYTVASHLEDEARLADIQKRAHVRFKEIVKVSRKSTGLSRKRRVLRGMAAKVGLDWPAWQRMEKYHLGTLLIELLIRSTGLIEQVKQVSSKGKSFKTEVLLRPSAKALDWMRSSEEANRLLYPLYLPTTYRPYDWEDQWTGGYSSNIYLRWPLFLVRSDVLRDMTPERMPEVYRAVNSLQRTPWQVNQNVLEMVEYCWSEGLSLGGLPAVDPEELPPKPWAEGERPGDDILKDWKRQAARVYDANARLAAKRGRLSRLLYVAKAYRHQPFYYPYKADFRGRFYPIPGFLSPQGEDVSRGLLEFAEAKPLQPDDEAGRAWLMIHGANCWGEDKVSFADRVAWVERNEAMILAVARDPFEAPQWSDASEPWQFLAFCFEYDAMLDAHGRGVAHMTRLPVGMDGSNNGLQLYSLLLRDPVGAKATNVSPSDVPQDAYAEVAAAVYAKLCEDADSGEEEEQVLARNWLAFVGPSLPRAATKRPVMTLPYGATIYAAREYVEDWYEEELAERGLKRDRPFARSYEHIRYLTGLIWDAIHSVVVGARSAMDWLQKVADICSEAGSPVSWTSPSGFYISQLSTLMEGIRIRTKVGDKIISRKGTAPAEGKISKRAMRNGLPPNFVHGLDAAVLTKTVNAAVAAGITDFAVVHDCYATHCTNAADLARILRRTVADIFAGDVLAEFKTTIEEQLGTALPPLPPYGDLDPSVVRSSLYFFA